VYGISDKVLSMALSVLLLAAPKKMRLWAEVGAGGLPCAQMSNDHGA
jgi:hypothetical protein